MGAHKLPVSRDFRLYCADLTVHKCCKNTSFQLAKESVYYIVIFRSNVLFNIYNKTIGNIHSFY